MHSDFIKVVENSRSNKIKKEGNPDLFTGEFWSGATAQKLGLIDRIGNAEYKKNLMKKVVVQETKSPTNNNKDRKSVV